MEWASLLSTTRQRQLGDGSKPERAGGDARSEFDRDYDRAVFCTPLRRMQDKAQVFPLEQCDAIRTRLTHSLEVSTVARDLARDIARWLCQEKKVVNEEEARSIEVIAATCGLLHDLGNPPFGHAGEQAIAEWFQCHDPCLKDLGKILAADFLRFEGNAQTMRLVTRLQILVHPQGLNLTCGTLAALRKYIAASSEDPGGRHELSKPGFFQSEAELLRQVSEQTGTTSARHPITYLVEAADDIAYSVVDLEDGVKKGLIRWTELRALLKDAANDEGMTKCLDESDAYVDGGPIHITGKPRDEACAQMFRTFCMLAVVPSVRESFKQRYEAIMNGEYHGELIKDSSAAAIVKACKDVGRKHVYVAGEVPELELRGRRVLHDLLALFMEGMQGGAFAKKIEGSFPRTIARRIGSPIPIYHMPTAIGRW